jgi:mycothiol synthase
MDGLPQLLMRRDTLSDLPRVSIEFGYLLRTYRPGDDALWCSITDGGAGETWTRARFRTEILGSPGFDPRSILFVTLGSRPVGTAAGWRLSPRNGDTALLSMLAVRNEHRRKGIGRFLIVKALEYMRSAGFTSCVVKADDECIEAIECYMAVGFRPEYAHESHRSRWEEILRKIGGPATGSA